MIKQLLAESNTSANIENGRPTLVGLTRKINDKIFKDICGIQPASQPRATVYGIRYKMVSQDGSKTRETQGSHRTGTGKHPFKDHGLPVGSDSMTVGSHFSEYDYVFGAVKDGDYAGLTEKQLLASVLTGDLRLVTDADEDDSRAEVQSSRFIMDRWQSNVRSRRVKSPTTWELLHDMQGNNLDGSSAVEDLLATSISDEINSDIIMKTITVAKKGTPLNLSNGELYQQGRSLIARALELGADIQRNTTFPATFVLASPKVASAIRASGQVGNDDIIDGTNLKLVTDSKAIGEYLLVGSKLEFDGTDTVAPIHYSPYVESDSAGTYLIATDSNNLQPVPALISRYAITSSPDFSEVDGVQGDDWEKLANNSPLATLVTVNL
ncbi:hypothetical protein FCV60_03475 [Vibrio sp. F13]|uniref:hypothetical protein n=3 Tax=unclassified Vibrio TaxID=2614977 RepID=UPI0010BD17B9|nr:hypothetical protein [Vibrio sp. F13]TKF42926.1 hypothetical protein FCV49_15150 [Vibrio sp. F13]TKF56964.1 hypothetical protein FCV60_03475 [Vibrio sp. F13]TKG06267.1 hypothetical protein FCV67_15315 [Vibrio sp. F13]